MLSLITLVLLSQTACTSLEERVEIFDAEWCLDIDDESDPDHKGAPRRASAECFIDGDTFKTVGCGDTASAWEEIRLLGPDTPEKAGAPEVEEDECYAQEASAFLERVLQGEGGAALHQPLRDGIALRVVEGEALRVAESRRRHLGSHLRRERHDARTVGLAEVTHVQRSRGRPGPVDARTIPCGNLGPCRRRTGRFRGAVGG